VGKTRERNFIANVFDGALYAMAMSLVSQQAVLPVFVKDIGGGNIALGLIPVLWTFGFNFPQVLIAPYAQRLPRKKQLFLRTAIIQRIPWLLLSLVTFFVLDRVSSSLALWLFFILFTLAAVGGSLNLPVWFDLIAKLTPLKARGRLFAARSVGGAVLGMAGGGAVSFVLGRFSYPVSFGILLLAAFAVTMISYLFLLTLREENDSPTDQSGRNWRYAFSAPGILRTERGFRNYLVADALLISAGMANAFYAIHGLKKFGLPDSYAGTFTIAMMVSMIVGSSGFGLLADRFGHKINLVISASASVIASVTAILAPSVEVYLLVFLCSAATVALGTISRLPLIAELCPEATRPTSVALANLVTSPFILFGIVAGWIADRAGYEAVFAIAGVLALAALVWLLTRVQDPRTTILLKPQAV
jgi:MFS family permease